MMGLDYVWLRKVLTVLMSRFLSLLASEVWYVRPDELLARREKLCDRGVGRDVCSQWRQENTPHITGKHNPTGCDAKGLTQTLAEIRVAFSGQSERVLHLAIWAQEKCKGDKRQDVSRAAVPGSLFVFGVVVGRCSAVDRVASCTFFRVLGAPECTVGYV
jgi:hypothetical protein